MFEMGRCRSLILYDNCRLSLPAAATPCVWGGGHSDGVGYVNRSELQEVAATSCEIKSWPWLYFPISLIVSAFDNVLSHT